MLDLNRIEKAYHYYKEVGEKLRKKGKVLEKFQETHQKELDYLLTVRDLLKEREGKNSYDKAHKMSALQVFEKEHPLLRQYDQIDQEKRNLSREFLKSAEPYALVERGSNFIALRHDGDFDYDLIDLYTQERIELQNLEEGMAEYLIHLLSQNSSFLGYATREDLPLLMNLLETYDKNNFYEDMDSIGTVLDKFYYQEQRCLKIRSELTKAHMFDRFEEERNGIKNIVYVPFNIQKEMDKLKEKKEEMAEKDYYDQYFYLKILKERNIENLFCGVSESKKENVVNAYLKLSSDPTARTYARTASSLLNQEVLKRKVLKK